MTIFLVIGLVGVALAAIALFFGDVLGGFDFDLGVLDSDIFSTAAVAGFLGALGFAGAAALYLTGIVVLAVAVGIAAGVLFGWGAVKFSRFLKHGERSDAFSINSVVGSDAIVVTDIPAEGYGEIRLSVRGHVTKLAARSPYPIPSGTTVWVSGVLSPTAVEVSPTNPELGT